MNIDDRLRELGLVLPPPTPPVANYIGTTRCGELLFVSGRVSELRGEVGTDVSVEAAAEAARQTMILLLAIVKNDIVDLQAIAGVLKLHGFVRSAAHFTQQYVVLDGASNLLVDLFGPSGRHARTATGVAQLPFGAAVQLEMILWMRPL